MADNVNPESSVNPQSNVDPESLPQTEPTAAPIFDSGPFPEPLGAEADAELAEETDSGGLDAQPEPETWADADSGSWSQGDVRAWSQAEADSDGVADIEAELEDEFAPEEPAETPDTDTGESPAAEADADTGEQPAVPARSVVVPGQYSYLKWWKLVLVFAAVWLPAMAIGVGLYDWWVASMDKTPVVFVTLVYVIACTVGGLILAMMSSKPLVAATALALTSAVAASVIGAAPLHGHNYCQVSQQLGGRCLLGILPY